MKTLSVIAFVLAASLAVAPVAEAKGGHSIHTSHSSSKSKATSSAKSASAGSHSVSGYTKKNGTHVAPSHATNPNGTKADNWSTKGNVNPYTDKPGTKSP